MAYKLKVTEHADELLDSLVYHLLYRLKNPQAAQHLLDGIEDIYNRLEKNPRQFRLSRDAYLANKTLVSKSDSHCCHSLSFSLYISIAGKRSLLKPIIKSKRRCQIRCSTEVILICCQ